jgi:hypothetical protein
VKLLLLGTMLALPLATVADPLFESEETLKITLTGSFKQMSNERDKEKKYPAQLQWRNSSALPVNLQVRGNNRLKKSICNYPPLKVLLSKEDTKETLFHKQTELKMVVACKMGYFDYVRMEYLAYKIYAMLSDSHFKVRWLNVIYREDGKQRQAPGFFIEQKKRMGKRLGLTQVHESVIPISSLDHQYAVTVDLFQFMIGNTDYSNIQARGGSDCCHNIKLMKQVEEDSEKYIPVPYDFDNSGIINAKYASPPALLPIKSVTQRKYRGLCVAGDQLASSITSFQQLENNITALIKTDLILGDRMRKRALKYLASFYNILNNPKKQARFITNACRS